MSSPQQQTDISLEFSGAIPIEKFHRYLVTTDGNVNFGLLGKDGKNNYFTATPEVIGQIALEFLGLKNASHTFTGKPGDAIELPFETSMAVSLTPQGGGENGVVQFLFFTSEKMVLTTRLGPNLTGELLQSLLQTISNMANPPPIFETTFRSKLSGQSHQGKDTQVHFGQRYKAQILNILGLLVIRANLLEVAMVNMLAALLEVPMERAEAIFYSSQNMKARSDMLRATAKTAKLKPALFDRVLSDIEKIDKVSRRRNQLIHGEWSFKGDKFSVKERKPLGKTSQDAIESFKSIEVIVEDFNAATNVMNLTTQEIIAARAIAIAK